MKGLIGKKVGMNQIFEKDGTVVPVTILSMGPCFVIEKKTSEKFNYSALKLGYEKQKEHRLNKPELGQFKKAGIEPTKIMKEIRYKEDKDIEKYNVGDALDVSIFEEGKNVKVTGTSKGKGFAGVMKRWGFHGGPASHGAHEIHRHAGSSGAGTWPGRVVKGKKMSGHMGNATVTVKNLKIMKIDKENNLLIVKGAVPGAIKSYVIVRQD